MLSTAKACSGVSNSLFTGRAGSLFPPVGIRNYVLFYIVLHIFAKVLCNSLGQRRSSYQADLLKGLVAITLEQRVFVRHAVFGRIEGADK